MPKQPGDWLNDRYDHARIDQQEANERAAEADRRAADRRRTLRMVAHYPCVDDDLAIESAWDEARNERERKQ